MSRTPRIVSPRLVVSAALLVGTALFARTAHAAGSWFGFAGDSQHRGVSGVASQPLNQIVWQMPVDVGPFNGVNPIHYGSPVFDAANTVVVPVKVGVADSFRIEARSGADGTVRWIYNTDYVLPSRPTAGTWIPVCGPTFTPSGRLYLVGSPGTELEFAL